VGSSEGEKKSSVIESVEDGPIVRNQLEKGMCRALPKGWGHVTRSLGCECRVTVN
jgi:hypothetical protein